MNYNMAHPTTCTPRHRLLVILGTVMTVFGICSGASSNEFNENLIVHPLDDANVLALFNFDIAGDITQSLRRDGYIAGGDFTLMPKDLGLILSQYNVSFLHIALTQGLWREQWGPTYLNGRGDPLTSAPFLQTGPSKSPEIPPGISNSWNNNEPYRWIHQPSSSTLPQRISSDTVAVTNQPASNGAQVWFEEQQSHLTHHSSTDSNGDNNNKSNNHLSSSPGISPSHTKAFLSAIGGLFCSSLNHGYKQLTKLPPMCSPHHDDTSTSSLSSSPSSTPPSSSSPSPSSSNCRSLSYFHLLREPVCTENLTPWLRMLPCRNVYGLGMYIT